MQPAMTLERPPSLAQRTAWLLPASAGIFIGAVVFDALPAALGALGGWGWAWAAAGFALMAATGLAAGSARLGLAAWIACAGVWFHSLLEGVAAGAGMGLGLGAGLVVAMGLVIHLVPESAALFALATEAGLTARRALGRCAVTWGLVVAGFAATQLMMAELPGRPVGAAMGLAAGTFTFLAWVLWQRRGSTGTPGLGALLGFAWVAAIHLL